MLIELEAILDHNLASMAFLYGSAAMLIGSMIAVSWLCRSGDVDLRAPAMSQRLS